jgi:hypothetical protein
MTAGILTEKLEEKKEKLDKQADLRKKVLGNIEKLRKMSDEEVRLKCLPKAYPKGKYIDLDKLPFLDIPDMNLLNNVYTYLFLPNSIKGCDIHCSSTASRNLQKLRDAIAQRSLKEKDYNDLFNENKPFCVCAPRFNYPFKYPFWFQWKEFYFNKQKYYTASEPDYEKRGKAGLKIKRPIFRKPKKLIEI